MPFYFMVLLRGPVPASVHVGKASFWTLMRWCLVALFSAAADAEAATFVVTNRADSGPGTLRQQIFTANTSPGAPHRLTFNLPAPYTISPSNAYWAVTNNTLIDGSSQPGFLGAPIVVLTGTNAAAFTPGLILGGVGSGVRAFRIEQFDDATAVIIRGKSNVVDGCHIVSNYLGINIMPEASLASIGGINLTNRTVVSAHSSAGILIQSTNGENLVRGCMIGTDVLGSSALGATNNFYGIQISGSPNNTLGGTIAGAMNVISGNRSAGVMIFGAGARGNLVAGNRIGTAINGTAAIPNDSGVVIDTASSNTIGSSLQGRNIISGNSGIGVSVVNASSRGNNISFNYIGITTNGQAQPNSASGVYISSPQSIVAYNVISANGGSGLDLSGASALSNTVFGNIIGLNHLGSSARSNTLYGISLQSGASHNRIGLSSLSESNRNTISGNGLSGIAISGTSCVGNVILNSGIGCNTNGTVRIANREHGVWILDAVDTHVGQAAGGAASRNLISGNVLNGIYVQGANTRNTQIENNYIGLNAAGAASLGGQAHGIHISSGSDHLIGPDRNNIAGNTGAGIRIDGFATNVTIQGASIGADAAGTSRVPNSLNGIEVLQGRDITIQANLISGNNDNGVYAQGPDVADLAIFGNFIGVGASGATAVSNRFSGVLIAGVPNTQIGSTNSGAGNVISGNGAHGIEFGAGSSTGSVIAANFIGSSVSGSTALRNGGAGVYASYDFDIQVGGPTPAWGNLISGNERGIHLVGCNDWLISQNFIGPRSSLAAALTNRIAGIYLEANCRRDLIEDNLISGNDGPGILLENSSDLPIRGNRIGMGSGPLAPLPNNGPGILAGNCSNILYGGYAASDANRIAFNNGPGIAVTSYFLPLICATKCTGT